MGTGKDVSTEPHAPWVIVSGGVHRLGGTDRANFALTKFLLDKGVPVHVVTHQIDPELASREGAYIDLVPVPGKWGFAGERLLSAKGRQVARRVTASNPSARVVVNGGNCLWRDINWVHYVHHAWSRDGLSGSWVDGIKQRAVASSARSREASNLRSAKLIIANSELTRRHLIELLHVDPNVVHSLYLGNDWSPANDAERTAARHHFELPGRKVVVVFIGAIGHDHRKGHDVLWKAWQQLCSRPDWDANLIVAGEGRALPQWRESAATLGLCNRVRFLGFTDRIQALLAGADLLVSPVRYESYGLNVQEALCRGVPAIVSAGAGVAERYPANMKELLLPDPEDVDGLVRRMLLWRSNVEHWREQTLKLSKELSEYTWRDMAEHFYSLASAPSRTW